MKNLIKSSTIATDLVLTGIVGIVVFILAGKFDILEKTVELSQRYESYEIDEIITVIIFLVFALSFIIFRQYKKYHCLNSSMKAQNKKLADALDQIKALHGFLPICASCKKIRDDQGCWQQIEIYIRDHSDAEFTHSICPDCDKKLYSKYYNSDE